MKHNLTDKERDHIVKLLNLGMSAKETAELLGVSSSTVFYISQAYRACLAKDFDTLNRLYRQNVRPTVEWALRFTNTEFVYEFEEDSAASVAEESNDTVPAEVPDSKDTELYKTLMDIRDILNEIRDILK